MATVQLTAVTNLTALDDDNTYIVDTGVTISATNDDCIFGTESATGNLIRVLGTLDATGGAAVYLQGNRSKVQVASSGSLTSDETAIWLTGTNSSASNAGSITAEFFGIRVQADGATITNSSAITVTNGTGIRVDGSGGKVENSGTINATVGVNGDAGQTLSLTNTGTVTGSTASFDGSAAKDAVVNRGDMSGKIELRAGNDSITVTAAGSVNGAILGGIGNDTYRVSNAGLDLVEVGNQGKDRVVSSVTFTLDANFEVLQLSGGGNIGGTGNSARNTLIGNTGNNALAGGGAADTFVFSNQIGRDRITDFAANGTSHDIIDLRTVTAITDFNDLQDNHMFRDGSDVVIRINSANTIRIEDVTLNSLNAVDFLF